VVTSAGALVEGLRALGAKRVVVICPYLKPLTQLVVDYIAAEGFEVIDHVALEIPDNLAVGRHDPQRLLEIYKTLDWKGADAIVLSACVQMPSLPVIAQVESEVGIPVVSAAVCTTYAMLKELSLDTVVPHAGALLSGKY
jgi:maleate isomerase